MQRELNYRSISTNKKNHLRIPWILQLLHKGNKTGEHGQFLYASLITELICTNCRQWTSLSLCFLFLFFGANFQEEKKHFERSGEGETLGIFVSLAITRTQKRYYNNSYYIGKVQCLPDTFYQNNNFALCNSKSPSQSPVQ